MRTASMFPEKKEESKYVKRYGERTKTEWPKNDRDSLYDELKEAYGYEDESEKRDIRSKYRS